RPVAVTAGTDRAGPGRLAHEVLEIRSVQGEDEQRAVLAGEGPALRVLAEKLRAAREEGEPVEPPRHRLPSTREGAFDGREAPLVQHKPAAGEPPDHGGHKLAIGPAGLGGHKNET